MRQPKQAISIYVLKQAAHFHFLTLELSYQLEDSLNIPIDMVSQDGLYEFAYKGYLRDRVLLYERGR